MNGVIAKRSSKCLTPISIGDVAIVMSDVPNGRALGRCFLVDSNEVYTLNQRIGGITPLADLNPEYLKTVLDRNQHFLNFDDGKKQTNLRKDEILSCPLILPPLQEQQAIIAKADRLLALCEQLETQITQNQAHAEQLMQAVLKEAFSHNSESGPTARKSKFNADAPEVIRA